MRDFTRVMLSALMILVLFAAMGLREQESAQNVPAPARDATSVTNARMLRFPDVSATRIAFVYAGDIWVAAPDGAQPRRQQACKRPQGEAQPDLPGRQVGVECSVQPAGELDDR